MFTEHTFGFTVPTNCAESGKNKIKFENILCTSVQEESSYDLTPPCSKEPKDYHFAICAPLYCILLGDGGAL